jgi:hypothetical protein
MVVTYYGVTGYESHWLHQYGISEAAIDGLLGCLAGHAANDRGYRLDRLVAQWVEVRSEDNWFGRADRSAGKAIESGYVIVWATVGAFREARAASSTINVEMDMLKKRFDILEAALAKSDYLSLSKSVPEIRNAIGKVDAANNTLNSTLSARITEASDIASGVITVQNAGALRDLDSFGPFRKAGYDTVNRIKNIGKPPGTTLTSIPKEVKRWINGDK